jgi:hypothetical protein
MGLKPTCRAHDDIAGRAHRRTFYVCLKTRNPQQVDWLSAAKVKDPCLEDCSTAFLPIDRQLWAANDHIVTKVRKAELRCKREINDVRR